MSLREVDFNRLPFRIRQYILKVALEFDLLPYFSVVYPSKLIEHWGQIPWRGGTLPKKLTDSLKYTILVSLGYHAIVPRTEVLRQKLLNIADEFFIKKYNYKRYKRYGHTYNSFYALNIFSQLSVVSYELIRASENIRKDIRKALEYITDRLEKDNKLGQKSTYVKDPVTRLVYDYYSFLLGRETIFYSKSQMNDLKELLLSDTSWEDKFRKLLKYIDEIDKDFWEECRNRGPKGFASGIHGVGIGIPWENKSMGPNETVGETFNDLEKIIDDMMFRGEVSQAVDFAKELDEMYESKKEKEAKSIGIGGKGFLGTRQFIARIRKVKYYNIILPAVKEEISKRLGKDPAGFSTWNIDEDPERLEIEVTLEDYGIIIPNVFAYKRYYVPRKRKRFGVGHVVVIIDTSGSMHGEPLEYAIEGALSIVEAARSAGDSVSVITFSGGPWLEYGPSYDYDTAVEFISRLYADGGTEIFNALVKADEHLMKMGGGGTFIFTDTYIWDIEKAAKAFWFLSTYRGPVYIFSTERELYNELERALRGTGVRIKLLDDWAKCMEISLNSYLEL